MNINREAKRWEAKFEAIDRKYNNQVRKVKDARDNNRNKVERKRARVDLHKQGYIIKQELRTIQEAI